MGELPEISDGGARTASDRALWPAIGVLIVLLLIPMALAAVANYMSGGRSRPGDEELTANFLSHEAQFDEVAEMLTSDGRSLRLRSGNAVDLKSLSVLLPRASRMQAYRRLLQQISAADFRYFPGTGKVILLLEPGAKGTWGSSKSYLRLPHGEPQPVVQRSGYYWHGPGLTFLTGDRRIKGDWFVHYDVAISLGFSPY